MTYAFKAKDFKHEIRKTLTEKTTVDLLDEEDIYIVYCCFEKPNPYFERYVYLGGRYLDVANHIKVAIEQEIARRAIK